MTVKKLPYDSDFKFREKYLNKLAAGLPRITDPEFIADKSSPDGRKYIGHKERDHMKQIHAIYKQNGLSAVKKYCRLVEAQYQARDKTEDLPTNAVISKFGTYGVKKKPIYQRIILLPNIWKKAYVKTSGTTIDKLQAVIKYTKLALK